MHRRIQSVSRTIHVDLLVHSVAVTITTLAHPMPSWRQGTYSFRCALAHPSSRRAASISSPGAFCEADFPSAKAKSPEPELLPPFGCETAPRDRRLTKTREEETIIINRPDGSTYPEEKSVLRSEATPIPRLRDLRQPRQTALSTPTCLHPRREPLWTMPRGSLFLATCGWILNSEYVLYHRRTAKVSAPMSIKQ